VPRDPVLGYRPPELRHRHHDDVLHAVAEIPDQRRDRAREIVQPVRENAHSRSLVRVIPPARAARAATEPLPRQGCAALPLVVPSRAACPASLRRRRSRAAPAGAASVLGVVVPRKLPGAHRQRLEPCKPGGHRLIADTCGIQLLIDVRGESDLSDPLGASGHGAKPTRFRTSVIVLSSGEAGTAGRTPCAPAAPTTTVVHTTEIAGRARRAALLEVASLVTSAHLVGPVGGGQR
jgi:hypothetical protein